MFIVCSIEYIEYLYPDLAHETIIFLFLASTEILNLKFKLHKVVFISKILAGTWSPSSVKKAYLVTLEAIWFLVSDPMQIISNAVIFLVSDNFE